MEDIESNKVNVHNSKSMKGVEMMKKGRVCELAVRVVAFALSLVAAVIVGVDKQTKIVPIKLIDSLPPLNVPVTAKWQYQPAFVYFVVTNAIACAYAALSPVVGLAKRSGLLGRLMIVVDAVMVALLSSGNGAAMAIGMIGLQGNSHLHWNKVCNVFPKFCDQIEVAVAFSLLASLAFLFLLVHPLLSLHSTNGLD